MDKKSKQYENDPDFLEFLNSEFDKTAVNATIKELAEFAFGSIEESVEVFNRERKNGS